jgi:hypothetical protein
MGYRSKNFIKTCANCNETFYSFEPRGHRKYCKPCAKEIRRLQALLNRRNWYKNQKLKVTPL